MAQKRVILVVRDGWGYSEETEGNAAFMAHTPNSDRYMKEYPWTTLKCTGNAVGLPTGTQGSSEPGHLTMGAGRVVWQPLEEIKRSIGDGSFYWKKDFVDMVNYLKETGGSLHLGGLLSDQGIHGTIKHLYALLELAKRNNIEDVFIHCFLDGRDVPQKSAKRFMRETLNVIDELGVGRIASISGRYYAMDRDSNWGRIEKAFNLLVKGEGIPETDPYEAIEHQYSAGRTDYYVNPIVITENGSPVATVNDGDAFVLWNFRSDRARQITYALTQTDFVLFKREAIPDIHFVCMSVYDQGLDLPVVFPQTSVENNLGITLSNSGLKQLRIAETEKYAHVTFFFNSQIEEPCKGEDRIMVPSPKVPSYADKPEMSAKGINARLIPAIIKEKYDFILVNYANGDLVGHSANFDAGVKSAEVIDRCLGEVVDTGLQHGYIVLVAGDHGNIETMHYPDGSMNPSHGFNPVPFIIVSDKPQLQNIKLRENEELSSISPTILELLDIKKPTKMTSPSLIS